MINEIQEFLSAKNYKGLKEFLSTLNEADIAECLNELSKEEEAIVFRLLNKNDAAEIFAIMDPDTQENIISTMSDNEISSITSRLFADDVADLVEELPANLVPRILKNSNQETRKVVNELLKYPEDSAGSIMTVEYVDLKEEDTVKQAFKKIKSTGIKKETVYTAYVTDANRRLVGVLSIKELLMAEPRKKVKSLMETNVITVHTSTDKEEVAKMFDKYDFLAMPVVDSENRLVGIVTVDDALDIFAEEHEEDFEKMSAMKPLEENYLKSSVFTQYKNRIIWLLVLMLSSIITGKIITNYQNAFAALPILVSFIPMIMDTGGNCGSQASTMVIRALATDEIETKDFLKVWFKEIQISLLVGISLAAVNGVRIYIEYQNLLLSLTIGCTLIITAVVAKSIGCLLPILAKQLKLDPAYMASPMITTVVDALSLMVFFNVALALMNI